MAKITVLSFNMQGVGAQTIYSAISKLDPDLVALQEAPGPKHQFYGDMGNLIGNVYSMTTLREYPISPPKIGGFGLEAQGSMKNYCLIYKQATLKVKQDVELVNFLSDQNLTKPKDVYEARDMGYAARPPAYVKFKHKPSNKTIGVFVWHAPTNNDLSHLSSLQNFDKSFKLFNEQVKNDLTIICGDFNNSKINAYFTSFDEGVQHKFDYILCDNSTSFTDLYSKNKNLLDNVHTKSEDHFMMAAEITF